MAKELSIFVDESGDRGGKARYYLLTLIFHDQADGIAEAVVRHRKTSMTDYRLEQVADCLCAIELALVKYEAKEDGETCSKFFGGIGSFKRNWLKQARSKRI